MELDQLKKEHNWVNEGNLKDSQGKYEEAIADYDKALQIDPSDADALFDKAETLQKMGKLKEAENLAAKALNEYVGN
ncbi:MAG: tetratricopeptide repeat protein [Methanoregula sp.]|nr:tetratricopeptide repeat protein [Methanoregula sp.]